MAALNRRRVPRFREAVKDGINCLLFTPRDAEALASAIDRLLSDSELRKRFGQASLQMTVDEFSKETVNQQTLISMRLCLRKQLSKKFT